MDWQTYSAIGIVVATVVIFLVRLTRPKPKHGCGRHCDCGRK
jgi:hypothetical protein